jgi:hypothetical protein
MHSEANLAGTYPARAYSNVQYFVDGVGSGGTNASLVGNNPGSGTMEAVGDVNWDLSTGGDGSSETHSDGNGSGSASGSGSSPSGLMGSAGSGSSAEGGGTNRSQGSSNFHVSPVAKTADATGHSFQDIKGHASHSASVGAPSLNRGSILAAGYADAGGHGSGLDSRSSTQVNLNNPGVPAFTDVATASATSPSSVNNAIFDTYANGGTSDFSQNATLTNVEALTQNNTVRNLPHASSSATAKAGTFGAGDYGRGHVAVDGSFDSADVVSNTASADNDPLVGPLGVSLNGWTRLGYTGAAGTASGSITGDGNSADNNPNNEQVLVFTGDTAATQGGTTELHFTGDSPQQRSGGSTTSNSSDGNLWVTTFDEAGMTANGSADTKAGGANNDADVTVEVDATTGPNTPIQATSSPGASGDGHAKMDDGSSSTLPDTESFGTAGVHLSSGSVGHGHALGSADNSSTSTTAPSVNATTSAYDGAQSDASAKVYSTKGLHLEAMVNGETPVSSVSSGDQALVSVTGNVRQLDGNFDASTDVQSDTGISDASASGDLQYSELSVNRTQGGAFFILGGLTLHALAGNDGTSVSQTTLTLNGGVDSNHDGYIDRNGFTGSATVFSYAGETTLTVDGDWAFSFDAATGTATLTTTRLVSTERPASGEVFIVRATYDIESYGSVNGADGSISFNG